MSDSSLEQQALQRRSYELSVLNDVARTLNASVDLSTLLQRALERVAELLGLDTGWVLLLDEVSGEPYTAAALNLPAGLEREPARMVGWCYCLESFSHGDLSNAANVGVVACSRLRQLELARGDTAGLRYHASIPLKVCGDDPVSGHNCADGEGDLGGLKRLGMLNVASPEWRGLSADELDLLRTIGDVLGVAIERARLHARHLEAAQAEERNRLAREIHDTIAQDFTAIGFQLETAEALLARGEEPRRARERIAAALEIARKGLEEARRSVLDLRAGALEGRSLSAALEALTREAAERSKAPVAFVSGGAVGPLPSAVQLGLYRIAQEALENAIRHAGAARVTVRLDRTPRGIRLAVEDEGRGFDVESVGDGSATGRFGLIGMRERARLLGGSLQIESARGLGTRIAAEVAVHD